MNHKSLILVLLLMLAAWHGSASAQVNFSVSGSFEPDVTGGDASFTITRIGSELPDQIVNFRAVSLSAVSDEHYPAEGYALHFAEGESSKQVHVWARYATPGTAFAYQNAPRSFRLVVYDMNGFELAHCDQEIVYGEDHNVPSDIYEEKDIVVDSGMTPVSDAGYASNPYLLMWSSDYYNNRAIKPYLSITNAKLNMRLTFEAKEVHDGYQYIQLLFDEAILCDNRSGCSNGDPGNINISNYMAGFSHYQPGTCTDWYQYSFPVLTDSMEFFGTMAGAWSDLGNTVGDLKGQKFRIWYHRNEIDGRLIIPTDFDFMCVRLNASGGGTDNDEWVARDFVAHIQAVDNTAPGLFGGQYYWEYITVDDMPHNRGNNFYISVPFDENVYASGTPTISTTWGEATYICGSGTNVLAFMGTIDASAGTTLQITGFDGTVQDLSGNLFSGSFNMTFSGVTSSENYSFDVFHSPSSNVYNIGTKNDLKNLAAIVDWGHNNCSGLTFRQTADINFYENQNENFQLSTINCLVCRRLSRQLSTIGVKNHPFSGFYDGQHHAIGGINFFNENENEDENENDIAIFGNIDGATIQNCYAIDCHFSGDSNVAVFASTGTGTLSHNYYHACTANGISTNIGTGNGDLASNDGAIPCYSLTLPSALSASGNILDYRGNIYVPAGESVTIEPSYDGYTINSLYYENENQNHEIVPVDGVYSFTMPAGDVTISVTWNDLTSIWNGTGTADDPYIISNCAQLDALAITVNGGNSFYTKYFKLGNDISYPHATDWNDPSSTENNYTSIGSYIWPDLPHFQGTFDGDGHTVSGIRIYKHGDSYYGLFGRTSGALIKNVTVSDSRITGKSYAAGIVGKSDHGNIYNCHVTSTVDVHAAEESSLNHGGIVGFSEYGSLSYCTSSATLSIADNVPLCMYYGGIAGNFTHGSMSNCLSVGVSISGEAITCGVIVGFYNFENLTNNFYHNCNRGNHTTGIGTYDGDYSYGAWPAQEFCVTIPGHAEDSTVWSLIASPMFNFMTPHHVQNLIATPASDYKLFSLNHRDDSAEWHNYKNYSDCDDNGTPDFLIHGGQGYLYSNREPVSLTFLGLPSNQANADIDLSYIEGNPLASWNLVGNPFPLKAYTNLPYYKMNPNGKGLVACPAGIAVPPCTGILVQATADQQQLYFRTTPHPADGINIHIRLCNAQGQQLDNAVLTMGGDASMHKTSILDSQLTATSTIAIVNDPNVNENEDENENSPFSVLNLPDSIRQVELAFHPTQEGVFNLNFNVNENEDENENSQLSVLKLIDRLTGAEIDLLADSSYTFNSSATDDTTINRFLLKFSNSQTSIPSETINNTFIQQFSTHITVSGIGILEVFDILGRRLFNFEIQNSKFEIQNSQFPASGVYIFRLNGHSEKVVIKR